MCNDSDPPSNVIDIEQVPISNKVMVNSDKGTIFTDEGSWSEGVAKRVGKDHGLCTLHKTTNIFSSRGGLGGNLGVSMSKICMMLYMATTRKRN